MSDLSRTTHDNAGVARLVECIAPSPVPVRNTCCFSWYLAQILVQRAIRTPEDRLQLASVVAHSLERKVERDEAGLGCAERIEALLERSPGIWRWRWRDLVGFQIPTELPEGRANLLQSPTLVVVEPVL